MSRLRKSGIKRIIQGIAYMALQAAILFVSAGRTDLPRAWIYIGLSVALPLIAISLTFIFSPERIEIINVRGEMGKGTKRWDKVFVFCLIPLSLAIPLIAGLDIGRFHWSEIGSAFVLPGSLLYIAGYAIIFYAMMANPFFELTVRIQRDRGHRVITTGPYRFVRHPGYLGSILMQFAIPLILGSAYTCIPIAIIIVGVFIRTTFEDKMLQAELEGYAQYAARVRYRLLPGLW